MAPQETQIYIMLETDRAGTDIVFKELHNINHINFVTYLQSKDVPYDMMAEAKISNTKQMGIIARKIHDIGYIKDVMMLLTKM